jgi:hypothetical protein
VRRLAGISSARAMLAGSAEANAVLPSNCRNRRRFIEVVMMLSSWGAGTSQDGPLITFQSYDMRECRHPAFAFDHICVCRVVMWCSRSRASKKFWKTQRYRYVIPAKAGIQCLYGTKALDPSVRWDDEKETWTRPIFAAKTL